MRTLVLGIGDEGRPAHYIVDIDGEAKRFVMSVETEDGEVHPYDREYYLLRRDRLVLTKIPYIVWRHHMGDRYRFPVDLHKPGRPAAP